MDNISTKQIQDLENWFNETPEQHRKSLIPTILNAAHEIGEWEVRREIDKELQQKAEQVRMDEINQQSRVEDAKLQVWRLNRAALNISQP